jgi:hypothetical protein
MHPLIDKTKFGSITINGEKIENDVVIRLDGEVKKRKKKLSKRVYGTSHIVSLEEAEYIYEEGADSLIFGTGQSGMAVLSAEAANFFRDKSCQVKMLPTPEAILAWNESNGGVIGLFHITC